uniref:hypothetical protein n=1 Tax=Pseudomonas sp. UBA6310 TaxID=1947327 RepID=UPI00257E1CBD
MAETCGAGVAPLRLAQRRVERPGRRAQLACTFETPQRPAFRSGRGTGYARGVADAIKPRSASAPAIIAD